MTESRDRADMIDPALPAEATEKIDAKDPIDPTDRIDPTEPIDRTEPFEAIERSESCDQSERREFLDDIASACRTHHLQAEPTDGASTLAGMSEKTCPDCGRPFGLKRAHATTVTGRTVCEDCAARLSGLAAGMIVTPDDPVGGAIATEGWYQRLRRRRKERHGA